MFDIPVGARHIVIEENDTSPHIIGECVSQFFAFLIKWVVTSKKESSLF